eukprot:06227_1
MILCCILCSSQRNVSCRGYHMHGRFLYGWKLFFLLHGVSGYFIRCVVFRGLVSLVRGFVYLVGMHEETLGQNQRRPKGASEIPSLVQCPQRSQGISHRCWPYPFVRWVSLG